MTFDLAKILVEYENETGIKIDIHGCFRMLTNFGWCWIPPSGIPLKTPTYEGNARNLTEEELLNLKILDFENA